MDLKIVCLLFGCLLSIALAQGEEEAGDGGSQENVGEDEAVDGGSQENEGEEEDGDGGSEECKCGRRRGGPGRGRRGRGGHGWGRRGGKDGENKCRTPFIFIKGCEEVHEQICAYLGKNKEEMQKCKEMETRDDKRICMGENFERACKSNEVDYSPACWSKWTEMFGPKE